MSRYEGTGLYHGTRRPFTKGGIVLPGEEVNTEENHDLGRSDVVYVTPDLNLAWAYAGAAKDNGVPRVVEVHPLSALRLDNSTVNGKEQIAFTCESAFVVNVFMDPN